METKAVEETEIPFSRFAKRYALVFPVCFAFVLLLAVGYLGISGLKHMSASWWVALTLLIAYGSVAVASKRLKIVTDKPKDSA